MSKQESAKGTIEDKLNQILKKHIGWRKPESKKSHKALAIAELQAIITTETTRALLANEKELTRRLKLLQKDFKKEQDNNNLVFTYVFDQVRQTANKARLKALQNQQPPQQGEEL